MEHSVRNTAVSGTFYPSDKNEISGFIKQFELSGKANIVEVLDKVKDKDISGLIVPHAGWIYSGKTATIAYKILEKIKPVKIALLGPSHQHWITRIKADNHDYWSTPLGEISIIKDSYFEADNIVHEHEHSLEVQAPFIRYYSEESSLLPLVAGDINPEQAHSCADHLLSQNYFLIISTDLSHFKSLTEAEITDRETIINIENLNPHKLDACGRNPLKVAFEYCKLKNTIPQLIDYSTSAEASGDTGRVVGYASFWL